MNRGASLLEVMISIAIVAIGILGVVAVFVVSGALQRRGAIQDATATHGRSAVAVFQTRGMAAPANWIGWNAGSFAPAAVAPWESICIDPRFVAAHATPAEAARASYFPSTVPAASEPRMRRVTLDNGLGAPMPKVLADSIFMFEDDLTIDRERLDLPAGQQFADDGAGKPIKRNSSGMFSWFATLTPVVDLTIDPAAVPPAEYLLAVVTLHQRPADLPLDGERVLGIDFTEVGGTGFAGGEALLTTPGTLADRDAAHAMLKVRSNQWILLAGNTSHSLGGTVPRFGWYRVTDAGEPEHHDPEGHWAVAVSLDGADWDLSLTQQQAVIVPDVVGVYEKTIRIGR